jgi:hypothetical protein
MMKIRPQPASKDTKGWYMDMARKHCCNFTSGKCVGGFFKVFGYEFVNWEDPEFANKNCVAHKKCKFFDNYVLQVPKEG